MSHVERPLSIVLYRGKQDNMPRPRCTNWGQLRDQLTRHTTRATKDGPAWSPTEYAEGLTRGNDNVLTVCCFVADVDDFTPAAALWGRWNTPQGEPLAWCLHSSYSSTCQQPKWRVIFPLSSPVSGEDWPAIHRKLTVALLGDHADPSCKDVSRLYYLPSCPTEREEEAFAESQEGVALDPSTFPEPAQEDVAEAQMSRACQKEAPRLIGASEPGVGNKPGDDYNERGDVVALLERHGGQIVSQRGQMILLRRPGKSHDYSATFGYQGTRMFYCFTSSWPPFEANTGYSAFGVYTLLEHGGDYSAAGKALYAQGYGDRAEPGVQVREPGWSRRETDGPHEWAPPVSFADHALPSFPVEALPGDLGGYATEVAASRQVPVGTSAMLILAAVAAAGAPLCDVRVGLTHREPVNLNVAVVADPGTRKTGVMEDVAFPLREAEREEVAAALVGQAAAKERRAVQEKRQAHLRELAAKGKDAAARDDALRELGELAAEMTEIPALPRRLADDVTPEAAAGLMAGTGGTLALFSAEGGVFGLLAGRYSDGKVNLDLFLKGHAGEEYRVDRKGSPPVFIPRACLTMGLAVQPDVLSSLADTPAFRGRGLLGRFLYSLPESLVGTRLYRNRPVCPLARHRYSEALRAVMALPPAATEDDPGARHSLLITGEALTLWATFADDVERRQADGGDLCGVRDWASKLGGAVVRIAGGMHLIEHAPAGRPWQTPISPETVAAAWAVGQYLIPNALAAFGQMGADARMTLARRILRWVERQDLTEFTLRDCHQANRSVPSPQDLIPALSLLCERGYLREAPAPPVGAAGGRPKGPSYEVNPLHKTLKTLKTSAEEVVL